MLCASPAFSCTYELACRRGGRRGQVLGRAQFAAPAARLEACAKVRPRAPHARRSSWGACTPQPLRMHAAWCCSLCQPACVRDRRAPDRSRCAQEALGCLVSQHTARSSARPFGVTSLAADPSGALPRTLPCILIRARGLVLHSPMAECTAGTCHREEVHAAASCRLGQAWQR